MYIDSISIKNFKCYRDIKLKLDPHFNLIIGGNNAGKSTILEALRLWQLAFNKFLKDRTNQQSSSFYANQYFSFTIEEISFLRINEFKNLFFNRDVSKSIEISLVLTNDTTSVDLPIIFKLSTEELNLRFELCSSYKNRQGASDSLLKVLGKPKGSSFKESMLITYVNPIFLLPNKEVFQAKGLIIDKLHQSKADEVIRNLIHLYAPKEWQTKEKQKKLKELADIEKNLHYIITGEDSTNGRTVYRFYSNFKQDEDSIIEIFARNDDKKKVELAQLGSGTVNLLNILVILTYGDYSKYNLSVLLLDEPDSHLHANHQKRLFEHLQKVSKDNNKQMFIITHNHELIDCAEQVLYIPENKNAVNISAIPKDKYYNIYKEIAPEYHKKMLEISEKKKIEEELKEIKKAVLICEGSTDVEIFKYAYKKLYGSNIFFDGNIAIKDGNSASRVGQAITSEHGNLLRIGLFDSDKEGINQFNSIKKNHNFIKDEKNNYEYVLHNKNKYIMTLPVPSFRKNEADWYLDNLCIEYMFKDETLEKIGIEIEAKRGNLYKTIKNLDSAKGMLQKKLNVLTKDDYSPFEELLSVIAKIIDFQLPIERGA